VKYFTENRVPLRARKESPSCPGRVRAYAWGVDARPCPTSRRQPRSRGSIPELHGKAVTISCASASGSWGLGRNWATFLPRQRRSKRSLSTRRTYHTLFAVSGPLGCKRPERSECYDDVNVEANQLCCELPTAPWPCSKGLEAANLPIVVASTL
jgi:hypothetical protein